MYANISYPLIRTRTCACQGVRSVSFSENFAYVLNGWSLKTTKKSFRLWSKGGESFWIKFRISICFGITNYQYFRYIRSIFMNQQKYNFYSMVIRRSVLLHWFSFRLCPMKLISFKLLLAIAYVVYYQNCFVFWRSVLSSEEQLKSYDFF